MVDGLYPSFSNPVVFRGCLGILFRICTGEPADSAYERASQLGLHLAGLYQRLVTVAASRVTQQLSHQWRHRNDGLNDRVQSLALFWHS